MPAVPFEVELAFECLVDRLDQLQSYFPSTSPAVDAGP
jgi:hypothetical protein